MKIRTLFLRAFGPFTDTRLDFSGPANLHLVFGANEAGKSSALRAITDLRYGIPAQSRDNFVHEYKSMLVAGAFEDVAGRVVGLARRKGNKDTLMVADPDTGEPLGGAPVAAETVLALTGGVMREQFETMYGLDSERLRRGGRQLIHGEGDLGAALFEASTGSANIRAMLLALQADAKKYYAARGQSAVLNEALSQLETARHRYKQAVTRPEQWKTLQRAHGDAAGQLAGIRAALDARRRRQAELAELRAVEPLLRQWDQAAAAAAALVAQVALPQDARARRLDALRMQAQGAQALADANEALLAGDQERATLRMEPQVLAHAGAIERLAGDLAAARRGREARMRLEAATAMQAGQLVLRARRMLGAAGRFESLDLVYAQAPSESDQTDVEHLLAELQRLSQEVHHAQLQLAAARSRSEQLRRSAPVVPDPLLHQALSRALALAQALGDTQRQRTDLEAAIAAEERKRDNALQALGLASVAQLDRVRWLPAAELDAYERQRAEIVGRRALQADRVDKARLELAAEKQHHLALVAQGEVVTASTLAQARSERESNWRQVRAVFIDRAPSAHAAASGDSALPLAFEHAVSEADRQADLLREGAQRAAQVAVCELRMQTMTQDLEDLKVERSQQELALQALDADWAARLAQAGLPNRPPAALREWQALRTSVQAVQERLTDLLLAQGLSLQQTEEASLALAAALGAIGRAPQGGCTRCRRCWTWPERPTSRWRWPRMRPCAGRQRSPRPKPRSPTGAAAPWRWRMRWRFAVPRSMRGANPCCSHQVPPPRPSGRACRSSSTGRKTSKHMRSSWRRYGRATPARSYWRTRRRPWRNGSGTACRVPQMPGSTNGCSACRPRVQPPSPWTTWSATRQRRASVRSAHGSTWTPHRGSLASWWRWPACRTCLLCRTPRTGPKPAARRTRVWPT